MIHSQVQLKWLEPMDRKVVWLRASGERWNTVCCKLGLQHRRARALALRAVCDCPEAEPPNQAI